MEKGLLIDKLYVIKGEFKCGGCLWTSEIGYSFDPDAGFLCPYCFMELIEELVAKFGGKIEEVEVEENDEGDE